MARPRYVQAQKFKLSGSGITSSDTTIILTSMKLPDGTTNIVTADLGDTATYPAYMTIEPGTSKEELISFTTITQNVGGTATLTGVTRGLAFTNPHAETSANKFSHAGGSVVILTNASVLYQKIIDYIDGIAIAGTTDASTTVKGIVEEATEAELAAGTGAGATGARLFISPANTGIISTSAGAADSGKIPRLNASGKLDDTFTRFPTTVRTYNLADSPATWTKQTGLIAVFVQCWGGGGSGGKGVSGGSNGTGGGGGGGSYNEKWFLAAATGTTETVTIGSGGTAVSSSSTSGNSGGTTTFGSLLSAYGGGGGGYRSTGDEGGGGGGGGSPFAAGSSGSNSTTGANGAVPVGLTFGTGGAGGVTGAMGGFNSTGGGGGGGGGSTNGGNGGSASFGGAGGGGGGDGGSAGTGGYSFYGGGGGGGADRGGTDGSGGLSTNGGNGGAGDDTGTAISGTVPSGGGGGTQTGTSGAGGAGRCIVTEFY